MYDSTLHETQDGSMFDTASDPVRINGDQAVALYNLVVAARPQQTLEIGCAYGYSTGFIVAALRTLGPGEHTAIDPFQRSYWRGIGETRVRNLGMADRFTMIEEVSETALPRLVTEGRRYDLVYIDGQHRFDNVLVDFFMSDLLLPVGGVVMFDDLWMPSVQRVLSFVLKNRRYAAVNRAEGQWATVRKTGDDDRPWQHYVPF